MNYRSGESAVKMDGQAVPPARDFKVAEWWNRQSSAKKNTQSRIRSARWTSLILVLMGGFLLGRAVILLQLLPFAIPFLAVIFRWKRGMTLPAAFSLIAGSATLSFSYAGYTTAAILLYFLIQSIVQKFDTKGYLIPVTVFLAAGGARFAGLSLQDSPSWYHLFTAAVEGGLAMVVTLIFFQSLPLIFEKRKHRHLKHEEVVCLVILLGSLLTGTAGWLLYQLAVENVIARYVVLIFAFSGGAAIGASAGVIVGLILSLANITHLFSMSLLAFAGLLGGLLKEGKKVGTASGLMVASLLMAMYADNQAPLTITLYESLAAVALFFLTPKIWTSSLAGYIPGTNEHATEQQKYLRKVRDVTAGRVEQFSELFTSLSRSFSFNGKEDEQSEKEREVDLFLSGVTAETCQSCMKKNQCWTRDFEKTYSLMENVMEECSDYGSIKDRPLQAQWRKHCIVHDKVVDTINYKLKERDGERRVQHQLSESRKLVADQLSGVAKVMEDFAENIQREKRVHDEQEAEIKEALEKIGIDVEMVEVYGLEAGNVDVEVTLPSNRYNEAEKVVAPLLTDILNEQIVVRHTDGPSSGGARSTVLFGSTKRFVVNEGAAHTAKGGGWVSGDSYSTMEIGEGRFAMAISDGMGNGRRAHMESQETIDLLKRILLSGIDEAVAIKSINSVLSLRSTEEMFSTLDLSMIDLQSGKVKFLKVGSTPSYIKRGRQVKAVEAGNLPIGMIREMDVDVVSEELKSGDLLIMMSDGIYEASRLVENKDIWMKRVIRELETDDPQEVADLLMERMIRESGGTITDDMTVLAARLDHFVPEWAVIRAPS